MSETDTPTSSRTFSDTEPTSATEASSDATAASTPTVQDVRSRARLRARERAQARLRQRQLAEASGGSHGTDMTAAGSPVSAVSSTPTLHAVISSSVSSNTATDADTTSTTASATTSSGPTASVSPNSGEPTDPTTSHSVATTRTDGPSLLPTDGPSPQTSESESVPSSVVTNEPTSESSPTVDDSPSQQPQPEASHIDTAAPPPSTPSAPPTLPPTAAGEESEDVDSATEDEVEAGDEDNDNDDDDGEALEAVVDSGKPVPMAASGGAAGGGGSGVVSPPTLPDKPSPSPAPDSDDAIPISALAQARAVSDMASRDAEEEKRRVKEARKHQQEVIKLTDKWYRSVLPSWTKVKGSKGTQALCWKGIPPAVRARAWPVMIGNTLNVTPDLYRIFLAQADVAMKRQATEEASGAASSTGGSEAGTRSREDSLLGIDVDIARTFPELAFFNPDGGPLHAPLRNILKAYVCYRPDVGYVQGMSYVAATLVLCVEDEEAAFGAFANLLANHVCFDFYRLNMALMRAHLKVFDSMFAAALPVLHAHFGAIGLESEMYMLDWLITLFSRALPLDVVSRVWDVYFVEGEVFLFRTALGLLKLLAPRLVTAEFETAIVVVQRLPRDLDPKVLFHSIASVSVSNTKFKAMLDAEVEGGRVWKGGAKPGLGGSGSGSSGGSRWSLKKLLPKRWSGRK